MKKHDEKKTPTDDRTALIAALDRARAADRAEGERLHRESVEARRAVDEHEYGKLLAARAAAIKAETSFRQYREGRLVADLTEQVRRVCPAPLVHAMRMVEREIAETSNLLGRILGGLTTSGEPFGYSVPLGTDPKKTEDAAQAIMDRLAAERHERTQGLQARLDALMEARRAMDDIAMLAEWEAPLEALLARLKPTYIAASA